jgi:hypothetical protein
MRIKKGISSLYIFVHRKLRSERMLRASKRANERRSLVKFERKIIFPLQVTNDIEFYIYFYIFSFLFSEVRME